jgi:hypothetical protein
MHQASRILQTLYCSLLLSASTCLAAETMTQYAVDIAIFADTEAQYMHSETWPVMNLHSAARSIDAPSADVLDTPGNQSNTAAQDGTHTTTAITSINSADYDLLDNAVKKLSANKRYRLLARKTWLQAGLNDKAALPVTVNAVNALPLHDTQGNNHTSLSNTPASISGTVKIVLERYLHLYTDLVYTPTNTRNQITTANIADSTARPQDNLRSQAPAQFKIQLHRRMRSKELHYLDHPLLGILIKIIPVETHSSSTNPSVRAARRHS